MSEKKPDGGFAFPTQTDAMYWHGMTLREWYAGQSLIVVAALARSAMSPDVSMNRTLDETEMARAAFALADAMLAHEAKEREGT